MSNKLRDINELMLSYLKGNNYSVRQDGKDIRFRTSNQSVSEVYTRKSYPAISVNNRYYIKEEDNWNFENKQVEISPTDNNKVETTFRKRNITMLFKVAYLVLYKIQEDYIFTELLRAFPRTLNLTKTNSDKSKDIFEFRRLDIVDMFDIIDNKKVYRKDFILQTHIDLELDLPIEEVRAYNGITVEENNI